MKEAKWTLASGKAIVFEEIAKKANIIKKITLSFGGNKFTADAKNGELIINGQIHKFGFGLIDMTNKTVKYKIDCYRRTQNTYSTGTNKKLKEKIFYLVGFKITIDEHEEVRYIVATDADKTKHEFQIISQR